MLVDRIFYLVDSWPFPGRHEDKFYHGTRKRTGFRTTVLSYKSNHLFSSVLGEAKKENEVSMHNSMMQKKKKKNLCNKIVAT